MSTMSNYTPEALDVVLREAERARQLQSTRVANMHNRAGVMLGASGLAAGLITTVAQSPWWILPLGFFALAALFGLLILRPTTQRLSNPRKLLERAEGTLSSTLKYEVVDTIAIEYAELEIRLRKVLRYSKLGFTAFALAVGCIFLITAAGSIWPAAPIPTPTYHVVIK